MSSTASLPSMGGGGGGGGELGSKKEVQKKEREKKGTSKEAPGSLVYQVKKEPQELIMSRDTQECLLPLCLARSLFGDSS